MIRIEVRDESYLYNIYHLAKAFFPSERVEQRISGELGRDVRIVMSGNWEKCFDASDSGDKQMRKFLLDKAVYIGIAHV